MPIFKNGLPLPTRHFATLVASRRLLKPVNRGNYAAIVEFKDQAAFQAMHSSPTHDKAGDQVRTLFDGNPTPTFYQVIGG